MPDQLAEVLVEGQAWKRAGDYTFQDWTSAFGQFFTGDGGNFGQLVSAPAPSSPVLTVEPSLLDDLLSKPLTTEPVSELDKLLKQTDFERLMKAPTRAPPVDVEEIAVSAFRTIASVLGGAGLMALFPSRIGQEDFSGPELFRPDVVAPFGPAGSEPVSARPDHVVPDLETVIVKGKRPLPLPDPTAIGLAPLDFDAGSAQPGGGSDTTRSPQRDPERIGEPNDRPYTYVDLAPLPFAGPAVLPSPLRSPLPDPLSTGLPDPVDSVRFLPDISPSAPRKMPAPHREPEPTLSPGPNPFPLDLAPLKTQTNLTAAPPDDCNCTETKSGKKKKKKKPRDTCFEYKRREFSDGSTTWDKKLIACEPKKSWLPAKKAKPPKTTNKNPFPQQSAAFQLGVF